MPITTKRGPPYALSVYVKVETGIRRHTRRTPGGDGG